MTTFVVVAVAGAVVGVVAGDVTAVFFVLELCAGRRGSHTFSGMRRFRSAKPWALAIDGQSCTQVVRGPD